MVSGSAQKALWGLELTAGGAANFGAGASKVNKIFGTALSIPTRDHDPSIMDRYGPGSRSVQTYKHGLFKGSMTIEDDLITPSILEPALGSLVVSGGAGDYTYTFSEADAHPTMEVQIAEVLSSSKTRFTQHCGTLVKSAELDIDANSSSPLRLSLDCEYAKPMRSNAVPAGFTSTWAQETKAPATFADAKFKVWTGAAYTEISNIDRGTIRIDQGAELKPSAGSNFPTRARWGERKYELSFVHLFTDPGDFDDALFGAAINGTATAPGAPSYVGTAAKGVQLVITMAGSPAPTWTWTFTNVIPVKHSDPVVGPSDEVMESVDLRAGACSLVVTKWPTAEPVRYG